MKEHFWKKIKNSNLSFILIPLSLLYYLVGETRNLLYQLGLFARSKSQTPTICVGNASVGGNGKTPLTLYLAKHFSQKFDKIGILSRGYGGYQFKTPHIISDADTSNTISDESLLYKLYLNIHCHIVISADRIRASRVLTELGAKFCIMDDGLQHLKFMPQKTLCLIDVSDLNLYQLPACISTLPFGVLREPFKRSLERTDRIVFIKRSEYLDKDIKDISLFCKKWGVSNYSKIKIIPGQVRNFTTHEPILLDNVKGIILLTSIAKPEIFKCNLEQLGLTVFKSYFFKDHHIFKHNEIEEIVNQNPHIPIICTEKDLVKLKELKCLPSHTYYLNQEVVDISKEGEELLPWIESFLIETLRD